MNAESGDKLKRSAETGDIDLLYEVLQNDPSIFENIDKNQFVETPLHIAASRGHLEFAIEIMNLKPSFATKLNLQGYSPIHRAIDSLSIAMNDTTPEHVALAVKLRIMLFKLVGINKDLVRVKGRRGFTPLHFACQIHDDNLLAEFLTACPDSIEDVTVRGESALHIAILNNQFDALQVLVGWLRENFQKGAGNLEEKIINHKDNAGNTVYHIAANRNDSKFLRFLQQYFIQFPVKTGIEMYAKNLENKTALDLASNVENRNLLKIAFAKPGSKVSNAPTRAEELREKTTTFNHMITGMRRIRRNISDEQRNTWLIIATLVATATYESALNPPGGVFQVSAGDDNNMKIKSTDLYYSTRGNAGKSILSKNSFAVFSSANMVSFAASTLIMVILTPSQEIGSLLYSTVLWFAVCYLTALLAISPTHANSTILYILISFIAFNVLMLDIFFEYFGYQQSKKLIRFAKNLRSSEVFSPI